MDKPFAEGDPIGTFLVALFLGGFQAKGSGFGSGMEKTRAKIRKPGENGAVEKRGKRFYWDGIVVRARFIFHTK